VSEKPFNRTLEMLKLYLAAKKLAEYVERENLGNDGSDIKKRKRGSR